MSVHKNEPVECGHCRKIYKNEYYLSIHLKQINQKNEGKFVCEICLKSFAQPALLRKHLIWHTGERPYACKFCKATYKLKNALRVHMMSHTGLLPHKCSYCPKRFATTTPKRIHETVHTGQRKYKCSHCERSFHHKKMLTSHYATVHKIFDMNNLPEANNDGGPKDNLHVKVYMERG